MRSRFATIIHLRSSNIFLWETFFCLLIRPESFAESFSGDLALWDTSQVTNFLDMFSYASFFNGNITNWDTSSAETMQGMFAGASSFNQPIGNWNVQNVEIFSSMFFLAEVFDADLSTWNTSKAIDMDYMFFSALAFNKDLCAWGDIVDQSLNFTEMFVGTSCPSTDDPRFQGNEILATFGPFCRACPLF